MIKNPYNPRIETFTPLKMRGMTTNAFLASDEASLEKELENNPSIIVPYKLSAVSFNMVREPKIAFGELLGLEMGQTEVTQELFQAVTGSNFSLFSATPNHPIEMVTWYDCISFCNELSILMGLQPCYTITNIAYRGNSITDADVTEGGTAGGFRLPTYREWSLCFKAGTNNTWAGTNNREELSEYAWYDKNAEGKTHPVGQKKANEWGLYDMSGNVEEWCSDKALVGGHWSYDAKGLEIEMYEKRYPDAKASTSGFRICMKNSPISKSGKNQKTFTANGTTFKLNRCVLPKEGGVGDEDLWMGETEVTQGLFQAVMGWNDSWHSGSPQNPVENVTWFSAVDFCNKLSDLFGLRACYKMSEVKIEQGHITHAEVSWNQTANGFRLPTDFEWQFFAKAGMNNAWSGTNDAAELEKYAWYEENSKYRTHPVGTRLPNEWGLYDMTGNLDEWCWDKYYDTDSEARVTRGGNWDMDAYGSTTSIYSFTPSLPSRRNSKIGFRICRKSY
jgi:sulfatase modifying factor 1